MNTVSPSWTSRGTSGAEALRRAGCAVLIALCAGLAAFAPATLGATDAAAIFLLARSVVKVEAVDAGGRYFLGTGIIVRRDRVVTACHVTRPARRITVLYGGLRHPVARQRADAVHDVCVLDVPALDAVPVPVGRSGSLSVGDAVIAVGFTGGGGLTPATGVVEGLFCHDGAKVILTDAGFSSGASGGGLFDADGRLVGLLMFRMRAPGAQFFAVPSEWFAAGTASDDGLETVRPQVGPGPFWRESGDALPYFMQAHSMESEQRWDDLTELARRWHASRPGDADALYLLGRLDSRRRDALAAIDHYRAAVVVDRRHGPAWYRLGMTYLETGRMAEARAVVSPLLGASQVLGRRLIDAFPELPE
ncbi:MAG: serine protease [Burkholderiales bacterium]